MLKTKVALGTVFCLLLISGLAYASIHTQYPDPPEPCQVCGSTPSPTPHACTPPDEREFLRNCNTANNQGTSGDCKQRVVQRCTLHHTWYDYEVGLCGCI